MSIGSTVAAKLFDGTDPPPSMNGRNRPFSPEEDRLIQEDGKVVLQFCEPNCTNLSDVLIIMNYHMLPFTPVPVILLGLLWWHLHSKYGWAGTAGFLTVFFILGTTPLVYNRKLRKRMAPFYIAMARYMKAVKVIVPAKDVERAGESHIIAFHPHGRYFYTCSFMIQLHDTWRKTFLPGGDFFGAAAAGFFHVPLIRHWLYAIGAMPADKKKIVKRLKEGHHVAIIVGGVKEVCLGTFPDKDELYLKKRKGFIRIAIEENRGVIPIYCFNENQLFQHDPEWKLKFWEKVNRYVNVGVPGMRGVLGMPMPFRRELLVVVGEPLYPKKGETVDELHARYIEALEALFKKYVPLSPHPEHKLVVT